MTTDAARKAVFETPELLEHIITFLPATVILTRVKRLSRAWKAAVDSSPAIRTKLWLPTKGNTVSQPASFSDGYSEDEGTHTIPIYSHDLFLNPFVDQGIKMRTVDLESDISYLLLSDSLNSMKCAMEVQFCGVADNKARASRPAVGPSDTWRDMYLTNPPIDTAKLDVDYSYKHWGGASTRTVHSVIRDHSGITLGLFYDMCLASVPFGIQEPLISGKETISGSVFAFFD